MYISRRSLIKAAPMLAVGSSVLASSVGGGLFLARPAQANEEFIDKQLKESAIVPNIDPEHGDMFVSTLRTFDSNGHLESGRSSFFLPSLNSNGNRTLAYYGDYETLDGSYFKYSGNIYGERFEYDFPIEEYDEDPFHRKLAAVGAIPLMRSNFGQFDPLGWSAQSSPTRCGTVQYRYFKHPDHPDQEGLVTDLWYPNLSTEHAGYWVRYVARFSGDSSEGQSARRRIAAKAQAIAYNSARMDSSKAAASRGAFLAAEIAGASGQQAVMPPIEPDQYPMARQYAAALATSLKPTDLGRVEDNRRNFDDIRNIYKDERIPGSFEVFNPFISQNVGVSADGVHLW